MTDRDEDVDEPALRAWETEPPPAGFADRVLAAREAAATAAPVPPDPDAAARRTSRLRWSIILVAACAALLLWAWRSGSPSQALDASRRTAVRIGPGAVAVAEAGGSLRWRVDADGARVDQRAGSVLYIVEPGTRFEVDTPHGRASVRGTSFRVEVRDMKMPKQALIGAAAGAALVIAVYEGRVLFAGGRGDREIAAGQQLEVGPDGAPLVAGRGGPNAPLAEWEKPPPDDASRDDLLARDARQRTALAEARQRELALRRQLSGARTAAGGGTAGPGDDSAGDGRPWFDPSAETLRQWADECRMRNDMPGVLGAEPELISAEVAAEMGMEEHERLAMNDVIRAIHAEILTELRKLYIEVTGDVDRAEDLAPEGMAAEIRSKSPAEEAGRVRAAIARERAGLQQPPADLSQLSGLERWMRLQARLGDETERRLAARIGPERARALRAMDRGPWGHRMEMTGCPRDGKAADDADRR